ncbi:hypothetical protein [Pelagicoccus mobilis]|uniref:Uncharacterized protein n=2 Tax=Pelagicoccus mobilis TaxID=415221 RepID=A0A934RUI5_9BACT|nr:hypothetical protein [Pelagicoccus mobilis]MBK1875670.1 hypothetical protein [Pelagicoccus mobilis]
MLLAYESRNATKDVDATLNPSEIGVKLVARVAKILSLHEDWLNSDVTQFLGPNPKAGRRKLELSIPGLNVHVATANSLLAMKALACRDPLPGYRGDHEDLVFLIRKIGIQAVDEIQERIDLFFPDEVISESKRKTLEGLIEEAGNDG